MPSLKLVFIFLDQSVYSAYLDVCEFLFMRTAHQENMQYLECMEGRVPSPNRTMKLDNQEFM